MKAYWRDDLRELQEYPACNCVVSNEDWETLYFEVMEAESEDFETEEGFNMILKHPVSGVILYVCSVDFNFKHFTPRSK